MLSYPTIIPVFFLLENPLTLPSLPTNLLIEPNFEWLATTDDIGVYEFTFTVRDEGDPSLSVSQSFIIEIQLVENTPPVIQVFKVENMARVITPHGNFFQVNAGNPFSVVLEMKDFQFDFMEYEIFSNLHFTTSDIIDFKGSQNRWKRINVNMETDASMIGEQSIQVTATDDGIPPKSSSSEFNYFIRPFLEEIAFGSGMEGNMDVHFSAYENLDDIYVFPGAFSTVISLHYAMNGGGEHRITYLSAGTIFSTDRNAQNKQLVVSYGPITAEARYPNVINVFQLFYHPNRDSFSFSLVKHTFSPFPTGNQTIANYNGSELRTTVGNFLGSTVNQIAVAQGYGGQRVVRLFEITDQGPPRGWKVVKQFFGLTGEAAEENLNKGQTLAAGDIDGDGLDEIIVGQTNSPTSQTRFHVIETGTQQLGAIESRMEFTAFPPELRGNGGIEPVVADLNGDGIYELIIASQGNTRDHGDGRDTASSSLITILQPVVENGLLIDFAKPSGGTFSVFTEEQNSSGAVTIAAGEMDGNQDNGAELVVCTNSIVDVDGFNVTARLVPPKAMYKVIKVNLDGTDVTGVAHLYHSENGKVPFDLPPTGLYPVVLSNPRY